MTTAGPALAEILTAHTKKLITFSSDHEGGPKLVVNWPAYVMFTVTTH